MNDRILWLGLSGMCLGLLIVFFPEAVYSIFCSSPRQPPQDSVLTWLEGLANVLAIWFGGFVLLGVSTITVTATVAHRVGRESTRQRLYDVHPNDHWD